MAMKGACPAVDGHEGGVYGEDGEGLGQLLDQSASVHLLELAVYHELHPVETDLGRHGQDLFEREDEQCPCRHGNPHRFYPIPTIF
jgi:hypothetical protein